MEKHHLNHIETRINEMCGHFRDLAKDEELKEFVAIIQKPGFTSVAERTFLIGIVDSMHAHTKTLAGLKQALVAGSRAVQPK